MSQQIQITGGAKVRDLNDVIIGTSGVLSSLAFNVSNGVPKLDVNGKILVSQLPNSVMEYLGTWDASTNTPTLVNGTGNAGDVYLCNVAGTVNFGTGPISFVVSDQVIYSGSIWQKASGTSGTVTSVGLSTNAGAITIGSSPITTSGVISANFNGTNLQYVNGAGNLTTFPTLMTSVGLTMPSAFTVTNSPLTGSGGTLAVTGAGYPSQYIRGDGTLADFPTSGGGGSSVSYYLNGGTSQGVIGGTTYYEMSKTAVIGTGVDSPLVGNGLIVAFLTDAGDPAQLNIPAGNWNYEIYASMSANGGTPQMYAELYKYDGTTFTLIATSSNEILYDGVNLNLYTFAMAVPATSLFLSDRLAVLLYATNSGGKTTTVHTQDSHLCQVITTFSTGITALNNLTAQVQYFATGTSGSDFNISSSTATHTFNLPTASASNRGALSTADWSTFNGKQDAITLTTTGSSGASTFIGATLNIPTYTLSGLGGVPTTRTLTINGVGYDLSADRSWTVSSMIYPSAGIAVSTGTAWGTSITDNSANWNTAYTNRITSATLPLSITSNVISITDASASTSGVITTGTQTIAGAKTLTSALAGTSATFSGNIGLGVTSISAWGSVFRVLEGGDTNNQSAIAFQNSANVLYLTTNSYFDTAWKYKFTDVAGQYLIDGADHRWYTAASGTADTALTWVQRMNLDASGNLGIGATPNASFKLDVYQSATSSTAYARIKNNRSRNAALQLETSLGNFLLGVGIGADTNQFQIYDNTAGANRLTISSTGAATFSSTGLFQGNSVIVGNSNKFVKIGNEAGIYTNSTYFTDLVSLDATVLLSRSDGLYTGAIFTYESASADNVGIVSNGAIKMVVNGTANRGMIIASTGNVGIGSVPSSWSGVTALQIGGYASFAGDSSFVTYVSSNAYYNGGWKYIGVAAAANYYQEGGAHYFRSTSTTGAAGGAITWTNPLTIASTGNVGIGTSSPIAVLDVNSGTVNTVAAFRSTDPGAYVSMADNTTTLDSGYPTLAVGALGNDMQFITNNSLKMTITSGGVITIANLAGTGNRIVGADASGSLSSITVGSGLSLSAGVLTATGGSAGTVTGSGANSQVPFWTSASNISGSSNFVWDNTNARLGIGISSPAYKLDVNGTGRFTGALRVESNSEIIGGSGGSDWLRLTRTGVSQWAFNSNGTGLSFINNTSVVTALTLASTGAATFSGDLTINGTNKNVQLGSSTLPTTSSNLRHYFAGAATFVGQDGVGEANVGNNFYYNAAFLRRNTDYASNIRFDAGNIYLQVAASGAANSAITWTNALTIASTGNVLIGTTTDATGKLQVNGTVYATAYYETSDIRLKNVIETNPKVNVSGIDVIKFTRTDNDTEQVRYGYSAQQVQTILPDVVTGQEYLNVNYTDIHTLKIASLELEIAELKELIKSLIK